MVLWPRSNCTDPIITYLKYGLVGSIKVRGAGVVHAYVLIDCAGTASQKFGTARWCETLARRVCWTVNIITRVRSDNWRARLEWRHSSF